MRYPLGAVLLLLLLSSGCTNLRYYRTSELWAEGEDHFDQGRYDDAIPFYDEILRRDDEETRALVLRGVAYERTGRAESALSDYAEAAEQGEIQGLLYSANLNISRGATAAAEEDLARLKDMGLEGRNRVIHFTLLGTLRLKQGQARLAAQNLERAVEAGRGFQDPTTRRHLANAHYNASEAYYLLGDFERAYDHFLAYAGGASPRPTSEGDLLDAPALVSAVDSYMLGLLAYLAGDFDAADVHLSRADPQLVARAAEILDDPSFGAARRGGDL
jgi:tetratricopeptide (TPR) repeat protein